MFGLYWALGRARRGLEWQNRLLLAGSLLFYGWWDVRFLALLVFTAMLDYGVGWAIFNSQDIRSKKRWMALSLCVNLGVLGFFKYFNFFIGSAGKMLALFGMESQVPALSIVLPVGISFYTFQTLSYTLDIYRGTLKPASSWVHFVTFVAFFPQLVAGPIERASALLPQVASPRVFDSDKASQGLRLILWGIFKKVVVADMLAHYVQVVYSPAASPNAWEVMAGTAMFAIQIYCDFSGYSDVAIGSARLLGFELMVNFKTPYFAKSLREFWSRWHISLTTWFTDYVYIPLGGNRGGARKVAMNVMVVFLISGLWHGAALSFVLWGAIHGSFYLLERFGSLAERIPVWIYRWMVLACVGLAWIFFRAEGANEAFRLLGCLGDFGPGLGLFQVHVSELNSFLPDAVEGWFVLGVVLLLLGLEGMTQTGDINQLAVRLPRWGRWTLYYGLIAAILLFGAYGKPQQFIYFQF